MNKSKKYYDDHLKAIEASKEDQEEDLQEDKRKMLHLADIM